MHDSTIIQVQQNQKPKPTHELFSTTATHWKKICSVDFFHKHLFHAPIGEIGKQLLHFSALCFNSYVRGTLMCDFENRFYYSCIAFTFFESENQINSSNCLLGAKEKEGNCWHRHRSPIKSMAPHLGLTNYSINIVGDR